jgi:hypothetical protein
VASAVAALVCAGGTIAGCGASYQAVYEGEVRFEHCYRLDLEAKVPLTYRRECWREWTEFYTYGQSRDRLEYAERRVRELSGQMSGTASSSSAADAGSPTPPSVLAPAPTNPFEPPPLIQKVASPEAGPDAPADAAAASLNPAASAAAQGPPGQGCMGHCTKSWKQCVGACDRDKLKPCRTTCDIRYRGCVGHCL